MDIVVTGAGGFSGSHIVRSLALKGHRITAVAGRTLGRLDPSLPLVKAITGDIAGDLPLPETIDAIVHAAARSPAPGVTDADMEHANAAGTERLIAYAARAGAKTLIYLSSLSIYGDIDGPQVDETTPIRNPDVYGVTKYRGEELLRNVPSLRSLSIRLPGVIGPHSLRNWLTGVLEAAKSGRDISYYNPTARFNNAIYINDLCDLIAKALTRPDWSGHDAVTVGAAGMTTVQKAIDIIVAAAGSSSKKIPRHEIRRHFTISSERAIRNFGYSPMDIEPMLRLFVSENLP